MKSQLTKSAVKQVAKTAVKVAAGDNVIVSSKDDATNNETTYTDRSGNACGFIQTNQVRRFMQ